MASATLTSPPASPVVNTGHCHPRVVAAIQEQAARIIHAQANILAHSPMLQAAKLLTETTAPNLKQVFWDQ